MFLVTDMIDYFSKKFIFFVNLYIAVYLVTVSEMMVIPSVVIYL